MSDYFTIYEHTKFKGKRYTVNLDQVTDGRLYLLKSTGVHDKMSSVRWRLSQGRHVIFYEHSDGNGRLYAIHGTGCDSNTHNNNFGDCASSWRFVSTKSIPLAFSKARIRPLVLKFSHRGVTMPSNGHMQGIQKIDSRHLVISGSSSNTAYFCIVKWTGAMRSSEVGRVIKVVRINNDFQVMKHNHASGIQLSGRILAVGTEGGSDRIRSSVVFYDLSNVNSPRPIGNRINRTWDTAGAIGIVRRQADYLLAVGGWDSNNVDFYVSNHVNPMSGSWVFTRVKTWEKSNKNTSGWIDGNWGAYQALNLLKESNGSLYLVGFNRNSGGHDWADLYSLNMNASRSRMLIKFDKKHVYCQDGASFRWGGGLYAPRPSTRITLLAVERDFHRETTVNYF